MPKTGNRNGAVEAAGDDALATIGSDIIVVGADVGTTDDDGGMVVVSGTDEMSSARCSMSDSPS